jgi:hypothetical protein
MEPSQPPQSSLDPPAPVKPRGFSGVVGISIALGILGVLSGLGGLGGLFFASKVQKPFAQMQGQLSDESMRRMVEVQAKIQEASVGPFALALAAVGLVIAAWVLVATRGFYKRRRNASGGFVAAMTALGLLELAAMAQQIVVYTRTGPLMAELQSAIFERAGDQRLPPGFEKVMGSVMGGAVVAGLVMGLLWSVAKISCCVYARQYAGKREVRAWVDGASSP